MWRHKRKRSKRFAGFVYGFCSGCRVLFVWLYALLNGHIEITHALLEKGANPNAHDNFDVPALRWAVRLNDAGLVEALLRRGARVNVRTQGQTALWQAQQAKQSSIVQILKQYGATL